MSSIDAMIVAYLVIGFIFWLYMASGELIIDMVGTLAGIVFYVLTFPYWLAKFIAVKVEQYL